MAATSLTRLNVALTISTGAFGKSLQAAAGMAHQFGESLKGALLSPLGLITEALAAGSLISGIKGAADHIDQLAKSADKLGVSTQSLAGLRLVADESGSSAEALESAMGKLQVKIQEAATGNAAAQQTFTDLKLELKDLVDLPIDQQFAQVADAINAMSSQGQQAKATVDLFGKSGMEMLNVLSAGSAGFKQATQDATAMGLAISRVDAFKVEEANDAFGRIGKVIEGVFNQITVKLAPFVTALSQAFTDTAVQAKGFGGVLDTVIQGAIKTVGFFADAWQGLTIIWQATRVGVLRIEGWFIELANSAVESAQWIGTKFSQAWTLVVSAAQVVWTSLEVIWSALKVPVADFVQFTASQLARLVQISAEAAYTFSASLGAAMQSAASSIQVTVGTMSVDARTNLTKSMEHVGAASRATAAATTALFSSVSVEGSSTLKGLAADFEVLVQQEQAKLADLRNQSRASDVISDAAARIQAEADLRAQGRANELAARQAHTQALVEVQSEENMMLGALERANNEAQDAEEARAIQLRQDSWAGFYDWLAAEDANNKQILLNGTSSFFGNLSKLQQTNDKKAQEVGKAAAKAKIVTDTASAAMGAYSAMASIPFVGPALGAAAAAAAILAGGIQLANVDKGTSTAPSASGPADVSTTNLGGIDAPAPAKQTLILQGDTFSAEALTKLFADAKERGYTIDGVRRE